MDPHNSQILPDQISLITSKEEKKKKPVDYFTQAGKYYSRPGCLRHMDRQTGWVTYPIGIINSNSNPRKPESPATAIHQLSPLCFTINFHSSLSLFSLFPRETNTVIVPYAQLKGKKLLF